MSNAENTAQRAAQVMSELKVSGHLMTLESGFYCVVQNPSPVADAGSGLPSVRLSLAPGPLGRPEAVSIRTFADDGWLQGGGDAALVRVAGGAAQILVTVYQAAGAETDTAPSLQVMRVLDNNGRSVSRSTQSAPPQVVDVLAHIRTRGDVGGLLGTWIGERDSKLWIEGFAVAPAAGVPADDIEYQAVLGRGWLSPWVEGGQFCGSRGMALPILGLRLRLRGATAETHECSYEATFVDGTHVGPVPGGEACEAESLAAVEAFSIVIHRRGELPVRPAEPTPDAEPEAAPVRTTPERAVDRLPLRPAARAPATPKITPARPGQRPSPSKPNLKPVRRAR